MKRCGVVLMALFVFLLCGCGSKDAAVQEGKQVSELDKYGTAAPVVSEKVKMQYGNMDWNVCYSLADLEKGNDYIVEGELYGKPVQTCTYNEASDGKKSIADAGDTFLQMKVTKVYKGNVKVGDSMVVKQSFGLLDEKEGLSMSEMAPMKPGEKWTYFLNKDSDGSYVCSADATGRYPIPNESYLSMSEKELDKYMLDNAKQLGYVKDKMVPSHTYFSFIKKYYKQQSLVDELSITSSDKKLDVAGEKVGIKKATIEEGVMYLELNEKVDVSNSDKIDAYYKKKDGKKIEMIFDTSEKTVVYLHAKGEVIDPKEVDTITVCNVEFKVR